MKRRGAATVWVRSDQAHDGFVERLVRADEWFADPSFVMVKDTRKTRVGRLDVEIGSTPHTIYVKRYNAFSLRYRIGSLFSRSAARRSLDGARILADAGIASARPIASVEVRRCGMLESSFFFAHAISGARTSDACWREALMPLDGAQGFRRRRAFLAGLAALFAALHARGIYHNDLKDANIMARAGEQGVEFALLDLEGVRRSAQLPRRRRMKNLVQLYRTLGRYLSRTQKLFLLKSYLGAEFDEPTARRRMATDVQRLARRVDGRKALESAARGRHSGSAGEMRGKMSGFSPVPMLSHTPLKQSQQPAVAEPPKRFQRRHLLIIGAPRTGTTLLATMISRHADIGVLNEDDGWAMRRLVGKLVVGNKRCIPNQIEIKRRGKLRLRLWKNIGFMREYQSSAYSIEDYLTLPGIKIVGIIRNGNDAISSGMQRGRKSFRGAAYRWCRAVEILHEMVSRYPETVLIVSFEDLVLRPKENMERVAAFLSVDYQDRMLQGPVFNPWYPETGMNAEKVNRSEKDKVDFHLDQKFPAFYAKYLELTKRAEQTPSASETRANSPGHPPAASPASSR